MTQHAPRPVTDRGAVLVHTAFALLALIAFTSFTADFGALWLSRRQAQNSADSAALAGAIAVAYDDPPPYDTSASGPAKQNAYYMSQQNLIYGQPPSVILNDGGDITFLGPGFGQLCPDGSQDTCIRVNVYRNQVRGNPLPTFFGTLVGITQQGVRATATAQILTGNATDCLKPWSIVDRWDEFGPIQYQPSPTYSPLSDSEFLPDSTFDRYGTGLPQIPQENDLYVPPGPVGGNQGTGFGIATDYGRQIAVKTSSGPNAVSPGWFRAIRIPRSDGSWSGGNVYRDNIETCGGIAASYAPPGGQACPTAIDGSNAEYWASQGCYAVETGNMVGPTRQGVDTIVARDPGAYWQNGTVVNSAFGLSPRIVPVGTMDIDNYLAQDPTGSNGVVRLVNIFGFFIEGMGDVDAFGNITCCSAGGQDVVGRLMTLPGTFVTGGTGINPGASFLKVIRLVR